MEGTPDGQGRRQATAGRTDRRCCVGVGCKLPSGSTRVRPAGTGTTRPGRTCSYHRASDSSPRRGAGTACQSGTQPSDHCWKQPSGSALSPASFPVPSPPDSKADQDVAACERPAGEASKRSSRAGGCSGRADCCKGGRPRKKPGPWFACTRGGSPERRSGGPPFQLQRGNLKSSRHCPWVESLSHWIAPQKPSQSCHLSRLLRRVWAAFDRSLFCLGVGAV